MDNRGLSCDEKTFSSGEQRALHTRLVAGDPTAPADLVLAFLKPLAEELGRRNPRLDAHLCQTAAEDALLALIKNPTSYRPERQTLEVYLRMSATGDLKNLLRSERRHLSRRADWESVELSPVVGKYLRDETGDPARLIDESAEAVALPILQAVRKTLTPEENQVLELMLQEERRTEVYSRVLGLIDRPVLEQRREVKRVKDRIKKRFERARGHHE